MDMTRLARFLKTPTGSEIQLRRPDIQLFVKNAIELVVKVLTRVYVRVPVVVLRLAPVEKCQKFVHPNDVGSNAQECYQLEGILHLASVFERIQHLGKGRNFQQAV